MRHFTTPSDLLFLLPLVELTGFAEPPLERRAHRWRYARVEEALGQGFGWSSKHRIESCGDWWLGARIEAAWMSGLGLAEAIVGSGA